LAGSTNKKVLIARFDRETLAGFVNPQTYLQDAGLELLTTVGSVILVPYNEIKTVSFVREFDQGDPRRDIRQFTTRPKMEGLWIRLRFRDDDIMDGLLPNNLLQMEGQGFTVVPPDPAFQNHRVFVPKAALADVQVLGVVGSPLRKGRRGKPVPAEQLEIFDKN